MDITQLLGSLNKQSHNNHHGRKQYSIDAQQQSEQSWVNSSVRSLDQSALKRLNVTLNQPPQMLLQILHNNRVNGVNNEFAEKSIEERQRQVQKKVYLAHSQSQYAYFQSLYQLVNIDQKQQRQIEQMLAKRQHIVKEDLENGKVMINHNRAISNKQQIEQLIEIDRARLIKIKEGSIRSKLDLLNTKMQQVEMLNAPTDEFDNSAMQELIAKVEETIDHNTYGLDSEKTKIAQDYIRFIGQQKRQQRKREQQRRTKQQLQKKQHQLSNKQIQQMKSVKMKQQLTQRILLKKKIKNQYQQAQIEKEKQVSRFLSRYRNSQPIFERKLKQFQQKFVIPQKIFRQQKLREIRQSKKSQSLNELIDHQKRYELIKIKQNQRKQKQKQMQLKSQILNNRKYFRGKVHSLIQLQDKQKMESSDQNKLKSKQKISRMIDYAKEVKQLHKPQTDQRKRQQILNILQKQKNKNKRKRYRQFINSDGEQCVQSFYEERQNKNRYQEGNSFMYKGNQKRKRINSNSMDSTSKNEEQKSQSKAGEIKPSPAKKVTFALPPHKQSTVKSKESGQKQKDIWQIRLKQITKLPKQVNSTEQFEQMKSKLQIMDKKAANQQKLMKHADLSIKQQIQQQKSLDAFYVQAIKNKISILQ